MRLVAKYTKEERIKYISHLDLVRMVQRALRRANIPVEYSQGFNPHPRLAFASAISVGVTSEGEYMDVVLDEPMEPRTFCQKMNQVLPEGMRIVEAVIFGDQMPSLMSLLGRAAYRVEIQMSIPEIEDKVRDFLLQKQIWVEKKGKKGVRQVDIRDMIHVMKGFKKGEKESVLEMTVSAGSESNLNPDLLLNAWFDFIGVKNMGDLIYKIHRLELFVESDSQWVTPLALGKGEGPVEQADRS